MNKQMPEEMKLLLDARKYPVRPHIGIGAVIIHNDTLCLVRRKYDPDAGKWAIPGGHLELGEKTEECARREAEEETGLKVRVDGIAEIIDKIVYDDQGKIKYHYVLINYFTPLIETEAEHPPTPIPASDALDARFVPISKLKEYDLTDSLIELLQNIRLIER